MGILGIFAQIEANMKRILLAALVAISANVLHAQTPCSQIFISEVVEGWSNNKAIEIFNPTGSTVDLTGIGLVRFSNGSTSFGSISYLDGYTIAPNDVLVIVLDKRDSLGTGLEAPVWDELQAAADVFINPTYDLGIWVMYFNGNDAVALVSNSGNTLIDLYGRIGEGTGFGGWSPYGTDAAGATLYASQDHTQIRKASVEQGVTTNPSTFDVFAEYDTLSANDFSNLGVHACNCPVNVNEEVSKISNVRVFPNPMTGDNLTVVTSADLIKNIRIYDNTGRLITRVSNVMDRFTQVSGSSLSSGVYTIQVELNNGSIERTTFVK